ncbi:MAG: cupin [Bryobacteraceae bacterium]
MLRESGLHVILLHLKSGEQIPEHQANGAISVHCMQGAVSVSAGEETVELAAGMLISLAAKSPHSLIARQDSLVLVSRTESAA